MTTEIQNILENVLPKGFNIVVKKLVNNFDNSEYIKIVFSPNTKEIHNVSGQYPQAVSMHLDLDSLELKPQIYGGNGGQCIYRDIDKNNENESYLAMKSVKVPFRKPKTESKFVLKAIERFAQNYLKTLKDNFDLLRYKDIVDYSFLN